MHHVILGAGPAGVIAAETIRKHQPADAITIVGDEKEPPYSRMAIPYLLIGKVGESGTWLRKGAGHFEALRIDLVQGRATRVEQWLVQTPSGATYLPVWWYNGPMLWATDPFGFRWAPKFQVEAVAAANLQPDYEPELSSYLPIDEAHLIRYTHNAKVLAWLGNDSMAKDDLFAQAEGIRFAYPAWPQDLWGGIIPTGLLAARNFTTANPGLGFAYGRGEAWGLDCAAAVPTEPSNRAAVAMARRDLFMCILMTSE